MVDIETINLDPDNRMLRIGFGLNKQRPFFRIDLWWIGFRITVKNGKNTEVTK